MIMETPGGSDARHAPADKLGPLGFCGAGAFGDVVVSSRVRLARNLAGRPFTHRASPTQRLEVLDACHDPLMDALSNVAPKAPMPPAWVRMDHAGAVDKQLLLERHLVSREMARREASVPRAVAASAGGELSAMVNEEDHLRLQAVESGFALDKAFAAVDGFDNVLASKIPFAWSRRFGYLTACPTNVGTGIRLGVLLHLPGLSASGEMEKVKRMARDLGLALRGLYGEGSEASGDLWQLSNQVTLGQTERELLADFSGQIVPQVVAYERQARADLAKCRPLWMADQTLRALGTLTHARLLDSEEALLLLSRLRLGRAALGLGHLSDETLARLMFACQGAHLQKVMGDAMGPAKRRQARAQLVREVLGATI